MAQDQEWAPVREWHRAVNDRDTYAARSVTTRNVVMGGPKGEAEGIEPLLEWIGHSGIHLAPVAWHRVERESVVVEQEATWPDNPSAESGAAPVRIATLFRLEDGRVAAALRFDSLEEALGAAKGGAQAAT